MNSELIKEAIADAKAVRATALQNAKSALEEVFSTQVTKVLSEKLREDIAAEEGITESDHIGAGSSEPNAKPKKPHLDKVTSGAGKDAGQKFEKWLNETEEGEVAPTDAAHQDGSTEETVTSQEIDELLAELAEESQDGSPEGVGEVPPPAAPALDGAPVAPAEAPIAPAVAPAPIAPAAPMDAPVAPAPVDAAPAPAPAAGDEDVDLNELLASLNEETEEEGKIEEAKEEEEEGKIEEAMEEEEEGKKVEESLIKENTEYRKTIEFLREQLNEVNLLNAKLLYTNKLFKANNLNNTQKMKVIEQFDLNKTIREVKLTYSNMTEALSLGKAPVKKTSTSVITEGFASKPVGTTKPSDKVIITEANDMAARFQKLAGITK